MSKKAAKITATYFISFLVAFLVIGGVGLIIMNRYSETQAERMAQTTAATQENNIPGEIDSMTVFGVYDGAQRPSGVCFYLFRFSAPQNRLSVVPLHSDMAVGEQTLYDAYRSGTVVTARDALQNEFGIPIERYMMITGSAFDIFSESCGNITYDVPYNLVYSSADPNENTIIRAGSQILDTKSLRKVLIYPEYKGGEEERIQTMGALTVELMNSGCRAAFRSNLRDVYDQLTNAGAATDISTYDFEDMKPAVDYVLERSSSPVQLLLPSGVYDEQNRYVVDRSFADALPRWFGLEE